MEEGDGIAQTAAWRKEQFKSAVATGAGAGQRRRQQAQTVSKERREALVRAKRVRRETDQNGVMQDDSAAENPLLQQQVVQAVDALKGARAGPSAGGAAATVEALRSLRRLLSTGSVPPVGTAVAAGVVPLLVDCLSFGAVEDQLLEAAWCLTNIASGDPEQTAAVLPAAPLLIAHLGGNSPSAVVEQCAWALGNIAGEGADLREVLLANGALLPLARLVVSLQKAAGSLQRTAAWALSNVLKGPGHKAASELIKQEGFSAALAKHLGGDDKELVTEIAWVLTYITAGPEAHTDRLIKGGILPALASQFCSSANASEHGGEAGLDKGRLIPLLRCIGNIVSGVDTKTDALFQATPGGAGALVGALARCVRSSQRTLQKEGAWALSNIAGGSLAHKEVLLTAGALPALLHLLDTATFDVRKEAAYALANFCVAPSKPSNSGSTEEGGGQRQIPGVLSNHLVTVVDGGGLPGFLSLVRSPDPEAARLGLQFTEVVLRALPGGRGPKLVEAEDGIDALESLQFHENDELRTMACGLVDKYYGEDYGLDDEDMTRESETDFPPWRVGNAGVAL